MTKLTEYSLLYETAVAKRLKGLNNKLKTYHLSPITYHSAPAARQAGKPHSTIELISITLERS